VRQLGVGSKAAGALRTRGRADQAPGRAQLDVNDGAIQLPVETHRAPPDAHSFGVAVHRGG
jgi:hypothetical protein